MLSDSGSNQDLSWRVISEFSLLADAGSDHSALEFVVNAVKPLPIPMAHVSRLRDAVSDAIVNAIAHIDANSCGMRISMRILISTASATCGADGRSTDGKDALADTVQKLSPLDLQPACGWGFFLIEKTVGACRRDDDVHYMIDIFLYLEGER
jgi:hypothetical protein